LGIQTSGVSRGCELLQGIQASSACRPVKIWSLVARPKKLRARRRIDRQLLLKWGSLISGLPLVP
jgi:hypothetical protein